MKEREREVAREKGRERLKQSQSKLQSWLNAFPYSYSGDALTLAKLLL